MPGEALQAPRILSSRQGFALSRSVTPTAGSAVPLCTEYKQTPCVWSMTRIPSQAGRMLYAPGFSAVRASESFRKPLAGD